MLILYGPDGPSSAASIAVSGESGNPSVHLFNGAGGSIFITFEAGGKAVLRLVNDDGTGGDLTLP
jgi:hypothetical protein